MSDSGRKQPETRGNEALLTLPSVGVAGSRKADEGSLAAARRIGEGIVRAGFVLSSGDANGVDTVAQTGALKSGGNVVMVLPYGLAGWKAKSQYRNLLTERNHLVLSEFASSSRFTAPQAHQRNRTIIGRSFAHIIVRSDLRGGSWQGGLACLEMGVPLLVVHRAHDPAPGNLALIERGGRPVASIAALREALIEHAGIAGVSPAPPVVNVRQEPFTVFIGRPSPYGNPFKIGRDGTRDEVIAKFRAYARTAVANGELDLEPLVGQVLGCYCKPEACHGDVLAEMVGAMLAERAAA